MHAYLEGVYRAFITWFCLFVVFSDVVFVSTHTLIGGLFALLYALSTSYQREHYETLSVLGTRIQYRVMTETSRPVYKSPEDITKAVATEYLWSLVVLTAAGSFFAVAVHALLLLP
jgi:hypothetical protein